MTCDVKIGNFKSVKPNTVKWNRSISNYSDSATVKVPAIAMLRRNGDVYERVESGLQFREGMKAEVLCGYNGNKEVRFKGFVRRVNFTIPLEIECEGYSYQLRTRLNFTKSYKDTTVEKILADLIVGTDIKLSESIPNIPIGKAVFENCSGIDVLDWLKEKCLLTVYFNFDTLYVGAMQLEPKRTVKFRLGWNVIKDDELKFGVKEFAEVRIAVESRKKNGEKEKATIGSQGAETKVLKTLVQDKTALGDIAKQKQRELIYRGYEGSITAFVEPYVEPGMAALIDDLKYIERQGKYFVTSVDGEMSPSGGRQKIKIGYSLNG